MSTKVHITGLSWSVREADLSKAFAEYGKVIEVKITLDRMTKRSKGLGYVVFDKAKDAEIAVAKMNGKELDGKKLQVSLEPG